MTSPGSTNASASGVAKPDATMAPAVMPAVVDPLHTAVPVFRTDVPV